MVTNNVMLRIVCWNHSCKIEELAYLIGAPGTTGKLPITPISMQQKPIITRIESIICFIVF
jgi:hypothetical protein